MIKWIVSALIASSLCVNVFAQEIKIGFVDGVKLIEKAPQGDAAKEALENEFKPREQEIITLRDNIRNFDESLDPEADNILQKQRDLRDQRRDLKRLQQEMREDLNLRRNEELAKLQRLISTAIIEIAKDENFDLILQDAVYAASSIDITNRVLDKLNAAFKSDQ